VRLELAVEEDADDADDADDVGGRGGRELVVRELRDQRELVLRRRR
jgi:hypothetical protein